MWWVMAFLSAREAADDLGGGRTIWVLWCMLGVLPARTLHYLGGSRSARLVGCVIKCNLRHGAGEGGTRRNVC